MLEGDALGQQLRNILDAMEAEAARFEEHAAKLEQDGWRIVSGGQTGFPDDGDLVDFACTDWRTGETLFTGHGTADDFTAAFNAAEAQDGRPWCQRDNVEVQATGGESDGWGRLEPPLVPGIPASLAELLVDWAETADPQEVAELAGLSPERVQQQRREPGAR